MPGIEIKDYTTKKNYYALDEYFPVESTVFVLDAPYYGCQAYVVGGFISTRIKVNITLEPEPILDSLKECVDSVSTQLYYGKFLMLY